LLQGQQRGLRRPQRALGGQHRQIIADPGLIALQRDIQRRLLGGDVLPLGISCSLSVSRRASASATSLKAL
jgi:hypothetical protein